MSNIYNIRNIFKENERKNYLKIIKPLILSDEEVQKRWNLKGDLFYPGKQSLPNLQYLIPLKPFHKRILEVIKEMTGIDVLVQGSWANWTNGNTKDVAFHTHDPSDYAVVYYLKTSFFNDGTIFEDKGFIKAPQNSILFFPAHLKHSAPTFWRNNPFRLSRYTVACNLGVKKSK